MEQFEVFFPNASHVNFLVFTSELRKLQTPDEFEVVPPIERRGVQNVPDFLKVFGKKKARKKLLIKVVKAMVAAGLSYVLLMPTSEDGPARFSIQIRIDNSNVTLYEQGTQKTAILDSTRIDSEVEKVTDDFFGD